MTLLRPAPEAVTALVRAALHEDAPWGDLTSQLLPAHATVTAHLVARVPGVLAGEDLATTAFALLGCTAVFAIHDSQPFPANTRLAAITGPAAAVLQAERVALNFIQRLSGIATLTARYVAAASGTRTRITDTRKTTPGLRLLERYAVRCGGGHNHRFSLSDAVMAKDNHLAVLARAGLPLTQALLELRQRLPHTTHVEVEVDSLAQLPDVLAAAPDTILLDNFSLEDLRTAVLQIDGRALTEASGGVTLKRIPALAATGVDLISVGALTHSVSALDLALDIAPDIDPDIPTA